MLNVDVEAAMFEAAGMFEALRSGKPPACGGLCQ
jgi:hypothetical protein